MIFKKVKISEKNFSLKHYNNEKQLIYNFCPKNNGIIAGEMYVKPSKNRSRHCIILASRFNKNSREENGPFPGWFIQIVGNRLSLGIGNGKTWKSITCDKIIHNEKWHHIAFSLDNNKKIGELYLDGNRSFLNNIIFRKPCNFI